MSGGGPRYTSSSAGDLSWTATTLVSQTDPACSVDHRSGAVSTHTAERTTMLPGGPADAWHAVMTPDIAPLIDPGVRSWQPDTEPTGVGTRCAIRGRLGGVPFRATSEVLTWELNRRAVFRNVRPAWPLRIVGTHTFEPVGAETRYTWRIDVSGPPPASRLIASLFRRSIAAQATALAAYLASRSR